MGDRSAETRKNGRPVDECYLIMYIVFIVHLIVYLAIEFLIFINFVCTLRFPMIQGLITKGDHHKLS